MVVLRTLAAAFLLAAGPFQAGAGPVEEQVRFFADCAGRLSAVAQHGYLFDSSAAERAEAHRDAHADLLEALLPDTPVPPPKAMGWRISAKAAQMALLSEADFGLTPDRRERARELSQGYISACTRVLTGA